MDFDEQGNPLRYVHLNTYDRGVFANYLRGLGWKVDFLKDEFDPSVLTREFADLKKGAGTSVVNGKQMEGNVQLNWEWAKITR